MIRLRLLRGGRWHVVYGRVEEGVLEDIAQHGVVAGGRGLHDEVNRNAWHARTVLICAFKSHGMRGGQMQQRRELKGGWKRRSLRRGAA